MRTIIRYPFRKPPHPKLYERFSHTLHYDWIRRPRTYRGRQGASRTAIETIRSEGRGLFDEEDWQEQGETPPTHAALVAVSESCRDRLVSLSGTIRKVVGLSERSSCRFCNLNNANYLDVLQ